MRLIKIPKFNSIPGVCKKWPGVIAYHLFWSFLVASILVLTIGGILFYKYAVLAKKTELDITVTQPQLKEDLYREILKIWQAREEKPQATQTKKYPDPFQP